MTKYMWKYYSYLVVSSVDIWKNKRMYVGRGGNDLIHGGYDKKYNCVPLMGIGQAAQTYYAM